MVRRLWPFIPFAAAALFTLFAALSLMEVYRLQADRRLDAARADVVAKLGAVRARLEGALLGPLLITRGLVADIIEHGDISDDEFAGQAATLLADYPNIRNFTLARGTVISAIHPLPANRSALGIDYRSRPDQWATVDQAIRSHKPVVAGPVTLIQGGEAVIGRIPIYLPGANGTAPRFFGLISAVIDLPGVFRDAGIRAEDLPFTLAIRGKDGLGAEGGMIWGEESVFRSSAVEMDVSLADGSWRLAAIPKGGWEDDGDLLLARNLVLAMGVLVAFASFGAAAYVQTLRRARQRIADSEERYRELMETAPMAVVVHRDGRVIFANSEALRLIGATRAADLVGRDLFSLLHEECHQRVRERIRTIIEDGGTAPVIEERFNALDGRVVQAEVASTRVMLEGRPAILSVLYDITRRNEAEAEREHLVQTLQRSNEDLQQFAYIASHDLQEPLRNIASYVQLLGRRYRGRLDSDADVFIDYAVNGTKRMQEMITSLLDYSRLDESDDQVLATDTSTVAARVLADLSQAVEEASAVVEIGALPVVRVREHEFARILQNLIGNALKYRRSDRAPRIGISAERGDGEWIFSVTDNGIGIAPEYREQVFTLFQRLHARSAYDGTGIGLAICRKLVLHNGGRIWVDSTDGEGSTFRFTLPMVTETA